jgi:hypothetical protein
MVAPISVSPQMNRGDSVIGAELKKVYRPYITALYLDHSYKFFAPNPGDSHLLRYDLYFADGTSRVGRDDQILPDRHGHWPRLLYHRHFMLTEFINLPDIWMLDGLPPGALPAGAGLPAGMGVAAGAPSPVVPALTGGPNPGTPPPAGGVVPIADLLEHLSRQPPQGVPAGGNPPAEDLSPRPLPPVVDYWRAAAAYLARRHGATRVDLYYRKHILPSIADYERLKRLDPPESYIERLLVSYRPEAPK